MSELNDKILSLVMESLDEKKMDAVGQEDGDVDNDGDEDESDAYILKRRKAIKKAMTKESVDLDEDITHQTVKPPNHTKKYSSNDYRDTNNLASPGRDDHTVTSSQADAHDKTAAHHYKVADAHTAAAEKSSSSKIRTLHRNASKTHRKAAEAHLDSSHSSSGADDDGSIRKTKSQLHHAYQLTMHANDTSKKARNMGTKAKRMNTEEVELDEAATPQMMKAANELEAYAKKSGGIDKADFMKAAKMLASGKAGTNMVKFVDDLDTDPREKIITVMGNHMGNKTVGKMFGVKIREETELQEYTQEEIIELAAEIMIEENIDYDSLSEEEINELLGAVARGIGKAAGAVGRGIASRVTMAGRADRATKKADKIAAKADNQDKLRAARQKIQAAKKRMAATKAAMRQDRQPQAMQA